MGGGGHCWHSAHLLCPPALTGRPHLGQNSQRLPLLFSPPQPWLYGCCPCPQLGLITWNLFSPTRDIYLGQYHCGVVFKRRFDLVRPCPTLCAVQPHLSSLAHTHGSHIPTRWQVAVDPHLERSTVTHRSLQPLGPQRKWLWRKHVTLLIKLFLGHATLFHLKHVKSLVEQHLVCTSQFLSQRLKCPLV